MKELRVMTLLVISFLLLISTGCTTKKNEIRIGVVLPLSGDVASYGKDCLDGIQYAVDEYNTTASKKVRLIVEDSQGQPKIAVTVLQKMIAQKINIVIGDLMSNTTLAMAPIADKNHVLLFSPGASNPKLSGISKYVFRNYTSDNFEGSLTAEYFLKNNIKRTAILYPNNDYGVGLKDVFSSTYKKSGGKIIFSEGYNEDNSDFRLLITKINQLKPEVLYIPGYYKSIGLISKQIKDMGFKINLFSNVGVEDKKLFEIAGDSANGLVYTAPDIDFNSSKPIVSSFVKGFSSRFKKEVGFPSAHGYDTASILINTISRLHKATPDTIIELLTKSSFSGVTGSNIVFELSGDVVKPFILKKINGEEFVILDK
jgi:branched-chain amino acid transport system substrate-binding protein